MVGVAVMGYGTIGSGVVEVLEKNQKTIAARCGEAVGVKKILDLRDFDDVSIQSRITHDFNDILNDSSISIVVEAMGGTNAAYTFTKQCLQAGKSVVTPNKAVVAEFGTELMKLACENGCQFLFEASVGGGIPIIRPITTSLAQDEIEEITGIVNGTTNFILTKMDEAGDSFEKALKEAQSLGYAEQNPEADVEGHDACRKISILTALVTGKEVDYKQVPTIGITEISKVDFQYAKAFDSSIKLVGKSVINQNQATVFVAPVLVPRLHPLYSVRDVFNGILVKGNMAGNLMFYGSGAGKLPTASAVVADILEIINANRANVTPAWQAESLTISSISDLKGRFFLRVTGDVAKKVGIARSIFGHIQVAEVVPGEFGFLTEVMTEAEVDEKVKQLDGVIKKLRVES